MEIVDKIEILTAYLVWIGGYFYVHRIIIMKGLLIKERDEKNV